MHTTIEIEQEEKLLIHENIREIERIRSEAEKRAEILNRICQAGVKPHQVAAITETPFSVGKYILGRQLEENEKLRDFHAAGIKLEATLPEHLQQLKQDLTTWCNIPVSRRGGDKFENLIYSDTWQVDNDALESLFDRNHLKIYVEGERLTELRKLEEICNFFDAENAPPHQMLAGSFLNDRITCDSSQACNRLDQKKFMIKLNWFVRQR
jgi:hypothetical protein